MTKPYSPKRIIGFLFDLWRISPILSWSMIVTQIIFAVLTSTVAPIFVSQLLTNIADGTATMNGSVGLLIGYAVVLFIGDVVAFRTSIAMAYVSETKMQATVAKRIFKHLSSRSLSFHANRMSGGIVSDANKLNGSIERFWDTLVFTAVPIITIIVSVCVALSFILWQYAIALSLLSFIVIAIMIRSQASITSISKQVAEKSSRMTAHFADIIGNINTVKAFAKEKSELKQYQKHINGWSKTVFAEMRGVLFITGSFEIMMTIMNVCAFAAAILATEYHIASIGAIYLIVNYTINVVDQLWSVSSATRSYLRIIGDASPMINTLDEKIEIKDPVHPAPFIINKGKIEFNNITFYHDDNDNALFDEFSLTINPGEQVGIIGTSGSGKTSLTRLLLRFSDVDDGQILIDGQDITSIKQSDLRNAIAYVPQEPLLFHRTLCENIAYSKPNASDTEILDVAKQANAFDFIKKLPRGLGTIVGERGARLSGGQRQRVAIARAILKNAPILVLDEATSALDSENEKLIQDAITKLMDDRTSIVIAHRLSTIAKLDRIIVLDNGKIVEQGSHAELIRQHGVYARLWSHQSGNFIEE